MSRAGRRAGQPVTVLASVLAVWIGLRFLLWQSPFISALPPLPRPALVVPPPATVSQPRIQAPVVAAPVAPVGAGTATPAQVIVPSAPFTIFDPAALASRGEPIDESAAHQLMWLAALAPEGLLSAGSSPRVLTVPVATGPADAPASAEAAHQRWSFTGWAFLRAGGGGTVQPGAVTAPSYGASQAGGVLRYRLAPRSAHAPTAYLRATTALAHSGDRELAAGLSLRPLAAVPLTLMAEGRVSDRTGGLVVRPAVLAVSEFPPLDLPRGFRAESYFQAGQIGSPGATAFADGQVRLTGKIGPVGRGAVRLGAGTWGGIQRGAARLDLGPTAQVDLPLGEGSARLALDYRVRVAGDASPGTGLALTLSTGF